MARAGPGQNFEDRIPIEPGSSERVDHEGAGVALAPRRAVDRGQIKVKLLEPPYVYNRPLIEEDGETVVTPRREGE